MALPLIPLKIDFWGIMPINLGGYNPHMALGPMGARGARPTLTQIMQPYATYQSVHACKILMVDDPGGTSQFFPH